MGLKIKIKKPSLPKISLPKLPEVKLGDPTKLITKPLEGVQNAVGSVTTNALDNVGKALQSPGAAPVIAGAATAFGGPEAGMLAGNLVSQFQKKPEPDTASPQMLYQNQPSGLAIGGMDNKTIYLVGGGLVMVLIVAMMAKR